MNRRARYLPGGDVEEPLEHEKFVLEAKRVREFLIAHPAGSSVRAVFKATKRGAPTLAFLRRRGFAVCRTQLWFAAEPGAENSKTEETKKP